MRFELFVAGRYLRAKRRQALIGVVTLISVIGIAAGVASLIVALAITNGMRRDLQDRLLGATSHVDLMRIKADGIRNWRPLFSRLEQTPHVQAAAPGLYGQVLLSRGARAGGVLLKGIVLRDELRVGDLLTHIREGSLASLSGDSAGTAAGVAPPIVIGSDLAETVGAHVGDLLQVTSPQGELTPLGLIPQYQRFRVAAVFSSGFFQYDSGYAFVRLPDAQRLFAEPDLLSVISFKLDDLYLAQTVGRAIAGAAGPGFEATSWMEQNRELFRALRLEQVTTFIVLALIVCVAALNILIALTMMVMERTRDIAVLMSFGVTHWQVRRIFLLQGALISVLGTVFGLLLGYAAAALGARYHFVHLDASVYSIDTLPFAPRLRDGLLVSLLSIAVSLLATLYPASAAARVLPAEALRYE